MLTYMLNVIRMYVYADIDVEYIFCTYSIHMLMYTLNAYTEHMLNVFNIHIEYILCKYIYIEHIH